MGATVRWMGVQRCLETTPDSYTVILGGRYISLIKLADETLFDRSHLSRVLSGKTVPSIPGAQLIAKALGLTGIDELLNLIEVRISRKRA